MNKSKKTIAAILAAAQVFTTTAVVISVSAFAASSDNAASNNSSSDNTHSDNSSSENTSSDNTTSDNSSSDGTTSDNSSSESTSSNSTSSDNTSSDNTSSDEGDSTDKDTETSRPTPSSSDNNSGSVNDYSWGDDTEKDSDTSSETAPSASVAVDGKTVTVTQMNNEIKNSGETTVSVDVSGTAISTDTEAKTTVRATTVKAAADAINNGTADKAVEVKVTEALTLIINKGTVSTFDSSKPIEITVQKTPDVPGSKAEDNSAVRGEAAESFTVTNIGNIETVISLGSSKNGQFANVYKINAEGKSEFTGTVKIENGMAKTALNGDGKYIIMTGAYSDLKGDADNDGKVNAADASEILKQIARLKDAANNETSVLDFNGDGKINAKDVVWILRQIAGINN